MSHTHQNPLNLLASSLVLYAEEADKPETSVKCHVCGEEEEEGLTYDFQVCELVTPGASLQSLEERVNFQAGMLVVSTALASG